MSGRVLVFSLTTFLLAAGCGHARSSRAKSDRATQAFGRLVRHRYGNENGVWACKRDIYPPRELECWAELHRGNRYRGVFAQTPAPPVSPTFSHISSETWTRRWRKLPFPFVHSFGARGSAWANAPVNGTDWAFLIGGAYSAFTNHQLPRSVFASDGPSDLPNFAIRFQCVLTHGDIVCTNGAGDALRLRPRPR